MKINTLRGRNLTRLFKRSILEHFKCYKSMARKLWLSKEFAKPDVINKEKYLLIHEGYASETRAG